MPERSASAKCIRGPALPAAETCSPQLLSLRPLSLLSPSCLACARRTQRYSATDGTIVKRGSHNRCAVFVSPLLLREEKMSGACGRKTLDNGWWDRLHAFRAVTRLRLRLTVPSHAGLRCRQPSRANFSSTGSLPSTSRHSALLKSRWFASACAPQWTCAARAQSSQRCEGGARCYARLCSRSAMRASGEGRAAVPSALLLTGFSLAHSAA